MNNIHVLDANNPTTAIESKIWDFIRGPCKILSSLYMVKFTERKNLTREITHKKIHTHITYLSTCVAMINILYSLMHDHEPALVTSGCGGCC